MPEEKKEKQRLQTKENERMIEEISKTPEGEEIAGQFKKGDLEEKLFRRIYEVTKDPNITKKEGVKEFLKAIAHNKFPKRGRHADQFLDSLISGTKNEKARAKELIKSLGQESTGPLSSRSEKEILKELTEIREEDQRKEALEETGVAAEAVTETAEIRGRVEEITETGEEENWSIEAPPKDLIDKLDKAEKKQFELAKNANEKDKELRKLEQKLKENPENEKLKKEVEDLRMELARMDEEMNQMREDLMETNEKWIDYLKKVLSQYRNLNEFSKRAGLDMNKIAELTMWLLKIGPEAKYMPTLEGLEIDPETGKVEKKKSIIKINRIYFERENPDSEEEAPGQLKIEYTDEEGNQIKSSLRNFLHFIDVYEGYEEMENLDEFNKRYAMELAFKGIEKGDTFTAPRVLKEFMEGEPIYDEDTIEVDEIAEKEGKTNIILNKTVTKIPKESMPDSAHDALRFDRKQKEFSPGEFGVFLRRNNYQRDIEDEEVQKTVNEAMEVRKKRGELSEEEKLNIPETGKDQNVVALDKWKRERKGVLRTKENKKGENEYELELQPTGTEGGRWWIPTIPAAFTGIEPAEPSEYRTPTIKKLKKRNLLEDANKGNIVNAPEIPEKTYTEKETEEAGAGMKKVEETPKKSVEEEISDLDRWRPEYYEEALPYKDIFKVGGMDKVERNFLKQMWVNTRFLSIKDIWEMGKTMWEYYKRRYERRQKERYSSVGKDLPFFSPEMQRINQAAENEQVNQFKESFEQKGIYEIKERLRSTRNRDEFKAAMLTLCEKGQMRWDDIDMWINLNRFVDPGLAIPIPSSGDPYTQISETDKRTGFDFLKSAIDSMWGEGTYNEWFARNKSTFAQNVKSYYEEGKQLEGVEGGHQRRLAVLLKQHKNGEFVDPHEYEGLITHAIDYGKSSMQSKIYYMIEGVAAENMYGRTILSFDRMAHINSEMLAKFPLLEYICASVPREEGVSHRFTIEDYKRWVNWFDRDDPMNTEPGKYVDEFMWQYVIPSNETQTRINKALRNGENLDHDDMFAYLPPATERIITDACQAASGSKKFLTIEGYANVFPGFSQYMKSLAENDNRSKLLEAIKSYVRYEGIMTSKFEKHKDIYQRMDDRTLNRGTVVTPTKPPKVFIDEINSTLKKIVEAYDDPDLNDVYRKMNMPVGDVRIKENVEKQKIVDGAYDKFSSVFKETVKSDNGEKMKQIIENANFKGMPF